MSTLIEHHTKYKEIHGVDESVFLTVSEHKTLHNKLRKEGKCNIPVDVLQKISRKAYHRTEKFKKTPTAIKAKQQRRLYRLNVNRLVFSINNTVAPNLILSEILRYNESTKTITYSSFFGGNHGKQLYEVTI